MIRLQNDDVSLTLEENGTLSELSNRKSGRILTLPHSLIRLIIGDPQCLELEAVPFGNPEIRKDGNTLYLHYPAIECEQRGRLEIGVELSIRLEGDEVQWGISLDNRTAEEVIREIHYPILTLRDPEPPAAAITSELVSERISNLPEQIRARFTNYMSPDQKYIRRRSVYPGRSNSMNCF